LPCHSPIEKTNSTRLHAKISEGRLPNTPPPSVGAASASGEKCSLCEATIEQEEVEYEFLANDGVAYRFHMACHEIWVLAAESMECITRDQTLSR